MSNKLSNYHFLERERFPIFPPASKQNISSFVRRISKRTRFQNETLVERGTIIDIVVQRAWEGKDDSADSFDATFFRFRCSGIKRIEYKLRRTGDLGQADWYWSAFFPRLNECAKLEEGREGRDNVVVVRWQRVSIILPSFPSTWYYNVSFPVDIRAARNKNACNACIICDFIL